MPKQTTTEKDKACYFCVNMIDDVDYKNEQLLRRFISSHAKIMPKRRSKLCSKHQRKMANAIKRARYMAILPYLPR
jgi:small subunit ribosomal protein S18